MRRGRKYSTESNHHITSCASPSKFFSRISPNSDVLRHLTAAVLRHLTAVALQHLLHLTAVILLHLTAVILHSCPRPDAVSPLQNCSRCSIVAIVTIGSNETRQTVQTFNKDLGRVQWTLWWWFCCPWVQRANLPPSIAGRVSQCRVYFGFHV